MPIRPEMKALYPDNWPEISQAIRGAANNHCEQCNAPNGVDIMRGQGCDRGSYMAMDADLGEYDDIVRCDVTGARLGFMDWDQFDGREVKIILTVAHIDHDPTNNDRANLKALCQRCHLAHDRDHHRINAAATRKARKATGDLLEGLA